MVEFDNATQEPSEVFDKGAKSKKGFLSRLLGEKGEVTNLGHVDDPLFDFNESEVPENYDRSYINDKDDNDFSEPKKSHSPFTASGRRSINLSSLLNEDDEKDNNQDTSTQPVLHTSEGGRKGSRLLGLLNDDDDQQLSPEHINNWGDKEDNNGKSESEKTDESSIAEELKDDLHSDDITVEEVKSETFVETDVSSFTLLEEVTNLSQSHISSVSESAYRQTIDEAIKIDSEPTETRAEILANAGYIEIIETLTTKVMLHHEIPNVSLESFGEVAAIYEPATLTITSFGKHLFAGNPLTDKQKIYLLLQIEELVEKGRKEGNDKIILSATQRVQHEGINYRTLLLSDDLLEDYMNAYNRTIMTNGGVASLKDLAVIINI